MEIFLIAVLTIVSSIIGTIGGFGSSTIMIPVLLLVLPPLPALLLAGVILWFGDLWKVLLFRSGIRWKLFFFFGVFGVIASYAGAELAVSANSRLISILLGVFLIAYSLITVINGRLKFPARPATALSGGALSGFFAGAFGMGGAIRVMFLSAFDLPKAVFIATAGAIGILVDLVRLGAYLKAGVRLDQTLLWGLLLLIPASFIGAEIGKKVVDRIPQRIFQKVVAVFLLLVGLRLVFN